MPQPKDLRLYDKVKKLADQKFSSKSGIYRSSWIVREYKRKGGEYIGSKPRSSGLKRWFKEGWVDLNRPIRNSKGKVIGYKPCGRSSSEDKNKYPLCRPSKRVSFNTPRTYKEIGKVSIQQAKREKSKVKGSKNIQFGGGEGAHDEKPHKCDYPLCEYASRKPSDLVKHKRRHTGEKPYKCDYVGPHGIGCEYASTRSTDLERHKRIHTGEKPYKCDYVGPDGIGCEYATAISEHLKKHKRIHTGEKPYKCDYVGPDGVGCEYTSSNSSNLKLHKLTHFKNINHQDQIEKDAIESLLNLQYGSGKTQYRGRRSSVMVKVPVNVKKWAVYAFKLKKLNFQGAKETGWRRAKQLATKDYIPIEDLRYMRNWFARHIFTSYPGFKKWKELGRPKDKSWHNKRAIISWVSWSGDAGFRWVNSQKTINLLNKHFNKNYKVIKGKK